jgi:hypothetical protein
MNKAQELLDIKVIDSKILKPEKKLEVKSTVLKTIYLSFLSRRQRLNKDPKEISQITYGTTT